MVKLSLANASKRLRVEAGKSVVLVNWHRSKVEGDEVLFVIYSYIQTFPDEDLADRKVYRWAIFVNESAAAGGIIHD
jgi:hypothetical protein